MYEQLFTLHRASLLRCHPWCKLWSGQCRLNWSGFPARPPQYNKQTCATKILQTNKYTKQTKQIQHKNKQTNVVEPAQIKLKKVFSSDRSSYRDSGLLLVWQLFQILSISAIIHTFFFLRIECRLIMIDPQ